MNVVTCTLWKRFRMQAALGLLLGCVWLGPVATVALAKVVTINHETGEITPADVIGLREGQTLEIVIARTNPDCFNYQYTAVEVKEAKPRETEDERQLLRTSFNFPTIVHDGRNRDYQVVATRKDHPPEDANCEKETLRARGPESPWIIPVRTYGWTLGFSGGFTVDELTDPVFGLEPATREGEDGMSVQGFQVFREVASEDDYDLGAAAMIHVYHTNPSNRWARWFAPLSFGLAVNDGAEVRYFLGPSVRFGTELFLTAGIAFGSVDRLPSGLEAGGFTTDANALQNLGNRTDTAIFLGLSYSFLGDRKAFQDALATDAPQPEATVSATGGGESQKAKDPSKTVPLKADPSGPIELGAGGESRATITLTASGSENVLIKSVAIEGPGSDSFQITENDCDGADVSADEPCAVEVTFEPGDDPAPRADLTVDTKKGGFGLVELKGMPGGDE